MGRLFDAVAAITGLNRISAFEGQAAMALEAALGGVTGDDSYPFGLERGAEGHFVVDWGPALLGVLGDAASGTPPDAVSLRFHNALAEIIVAVAQKAEAPRVILTGGCFQNRYLVERAVAGLRKAGIEPFWHEGIPPNDGGLAVGQVLAAAQALSATD